jgi:hypothetical protein
MAGKIIFNKKGPFFEGFPGTFALFQHSFDVVSKTKQGSIFRKMSGP